MAKREKVFDDPLLSFLSGSSHNDHSAEGSVSSDSTTATEAIRTIDASKVTLKGTKKADKKISEPASVLRQVDALSPTPAVAVVPVKTDVFADMKQNISGDDTATGIFSISPTSVSRSGKELSNDDVLHTGKPSRLARTGAIIRGDDESAGFDDLNVASSSMLCRETDEELNFEVYGRSQARAFGRQRPVRQQQHEAALTEQFDLLDKVDSLIISEDAGLNTAHAQPATHFAATDAAPEKSSALNLDALDMDAYIASQQTSSGGLFD